MCLVSQRYPALSAGGAVANLRLAPVFAARETHALPPRAVFAPAQRTGASDPQRSGASWLPVLYAPSPGIFDRNRTCSNFRANHQRRRPQNQRHRPHPRGWPRIHDCHAAATHHKIRRPRALTSETKPQTHPEFNASNRPEHRGKSTKRALHGTQSHRVSIGAACGAQRATAQRHVPSQKR